MTMSEFWNQFNVAHIDLGTEPLPYFHYSYSNRCSIRELSSVNLRKKTFLLTFQNRNYMLWNFMLHGHWIFNSYPVISCIECLPIHQKKKEKRAIVLIAYLAMGSFPHESWSFKVICSFFKLFQSKSSISRKISTHLHRLWNIPCENVGKKNF